MVCINGSRSSIVFTLVTVHAMIGNVMACVSECTVCIRRGTEQREVNTWLVDGPNTYEQTYIHTYMHTYIHTNTYEHTYIHTYKHIRTYIHTYIHSFVRSEGAYRRRRSSHASRAALGTLWVTQGRRKRPPAVGGLGRAGLSGSTWNERSAREP